MCSRASFQICFFFIVFQIAFSFSLMENGSLLAFGWKLQTSELWMNKKHTKYRFFRSRQKSNIFEYLCFLSKYNSIQSIILVRTFLFYNNRQNSTMFVYLWLHFRNIRISKVYHTCIEIKHTNCGQAKHEHLHSFL